MLKRPTALTNIMYKNYNRRCVPKIMLQTNKMNWVVSFKHIIQIKYEIDYKIYTHNIQILGINKYK